MARHVDGSDIAVAVARAARDHDVQYPAVAFAYYTFLSLIPFLVMFVAVAGEQLVARLDPATARYLTPQARSTIAEAMAAGAGRVFTVVVALGVLAWSAVHVAGTVRTVVERLEDTPTAPFVARVRSGLVVVGSLLLAGACIVLAGLPLEAVPTGIFVSIARSILLFGALSAVLVPLFYVPSHRTRSPIAALPGAVLTAGGWTVLLVGIQIYVTYAAEYAVYGVLAGLIILLTSLYAAGYLLMIGFVLNAMLRDWHESTPDAAGSEAATGERAAPKDNLF